MGCNISECGYLVLSEGAHIALYVLTYCTPIQRPYRTHTWLIKRTYKAHMHMHMSVAVSVEGIIIIIDNYFYYIKAWFDDMANIFILRLICEIK